MPVDRTRRTLAALAAAVLLHGGMAFAQERALDAAPAAGTDSQPAAAEPAIRLEPFASIPWAVEVGPSVQPGSLLTADAAQVPLPPPRRGRFKFLRQVGGDFRHLPSWDSFFWTAGGGGLAVALHPQDQETNARLADNDRFFNLGQTLGSVYVQAGSALGTYIVGRSIHHERVKHLGTDMLSAQIVAQTVTQALKIAVQRERPDGSNNHSFPSGHASATFATATVLQRHLGWKAAVPTYTIATYVAMSRLQENRHFLSDVVFGAALGVVAGRTSTRHGRAHWALIPDLSRGRVGILVSRLAQPVSPARKRALVLLPQ